jgi:hypothetical protein
VLGWFEALVVEVARTWNATGSWEAVKDMCHIELPRGLLPAFNVGVREARIIFSNVERACAAEAERKANQ